MGADQCATGQHGASCIDLGRVRVCRALFAVLSLPGFLGPRQPRMDAYVASRSFGVRSASVGLASSPLKSSWPLAPLRAARSGFRLRPIFFDLIYNGTGEILSPQPQPKD